MDDFGDIHDRDGKQSAAIGNSQPLMGQILLTGLIVHVVPYAWSVMATSQVDIYVSVRGHRGWITAGKLPETNPVREARQGTPPKRISM